jgi:hypothetical protein
MRRSIISVAAAVLCMGWMIYSAQPASAQAQPPTTQAQPPTPKISDQKLDQAAAAIKKLQTVRSNYAEKLSAASPDEKGKVVSEANAAMQKEYNSIARSRFVWSLSGQAREPFLQGVG